MASGKTSKATRRTGKSAAAITQRSVPWGTIVAVLVLVAMIAAIAVYYVGTRADQRAQADALAPFTPTAENHDPSTKIPGVEVVPYKGGQHVDAKTRVAYTHSPPFGGTHDAAWASCNGVVYTTPVRSENLVHSTEHGAVWIAYNPDRISGPALDTLKAKVVDKPYTVMSPYPGLDKAISLQSWGHQLKLDSADDPRIDQFIAALRHNQYTYPEVGASCQEPGPGYFTESAPPPYVPAPAPGSPGSVPENSANPAVAPDAGTGGR